MSGSMASQYDEPAASEAGVAGVAGVEGVPVDDDEAMAMAWTA